MKTVQFVLGLHNHQPVGNFDHVFAEAFERSYKPFAKLLEKYPGVRAVLHHTGPLLQWIERNRKGYIAQMAELAGRGQVELLGGAFYEPILPVIPEEDRIGQIIMMSDWIEKHMGVRPRGMWLAERVWEPGLPRALAAAGIEYTVLDDSHFKSVGIPEDQTFGYYLTEDQGDSVAVFPINERLRYTVPFQHIDETFNYLGSLADDMIARTAVMADDGEKFGVWPGTFEHCFGPGGKGGGWLEHFFQRLQENAEWIHMKTFADVLDSTAPVGRVYLPTASYIEMMEWAMPANSLNEYNTLVSNMKERGEYDSNKTFVRGGFWRSFFSKYDESNHMHKKMLSVSKKLAALPAKDKRTKAFKEAQDQLWQAQCNCGYWHGVFGGLYLTNLRTALYERLIAAEKIADQLTHGTTRKTPYMEVAVQDFDIDGGKELIVETPSQSLMFQPHKGGMMIEHDLRDANFNLLDTLQRRFEFYHGSLLGHGGASARAQISRVKEDDIQRFLVFDWYRRGSLVDHFLGPDANTGDFRRAVYHEQGDFVTSPYACEWKKTTQGTRITLSAQGTAHTEKGVQAVLVEKEIKVRKTKAASTITYRVTNISERKLETRFGVEFNVNLLAGHAPDRVHEVEGHDLGDHNQMDSEGILHNVSKFAVRDGWKNIRVEWKLSQEADHWRLPIETVSNSEAGIERIYQSTVVMPVWKLALGVGQTWEVTIDYEGKAK
ncbi:MAG: DUF1926 domain-containing protein [Sumerlaeia bacterium]